MAGDVAHDADAGNPPNAWEIYRSVQAGERLFQGEVIERLVEWVPKYADADPDQVVGAEPRLHKLAIVVTQDCDLEQDWAKRSAKSTVVTEMPSVLFCPAGPAEELRDSQNINSTLWNPIRNNKNERFQFLAEIPKDADYANDGHKALLIDFKSLFVVRTVEVYRQLRGAGTDAPRRRCRLQAPWAQHLQCRFAAYHARIGLPRDHFVPETRRTDSTTPR